MLKMLSLLVFTGLPFLTIPEPPAPELSPLSRQCCTATSGAVSITACSGWWLSDDANSLTRACEKATTSLEALLEQE